uniref:Uncharacterized protein n=1 Tax=Panagrolaimus davidi TaxID=227884 RepID=A0A914QCK6_9BILA
MSKELEKKYENYRETINELTPIINAQNELRLLCSFKKTFGYIITPAIYKESETPVSLENATTKKSDVKFKTEEGKTSKNEEISDNDKEIFMESNISDKSPSENSAFEFDCDKFFDFHQLSSFYGNPGPEFKSELSLDQGCQIPRKSKKSGNFPLISREFPFHNFGFDKKATNMEKIFRKLENLESIFREKIDQQNNLQTNDTAKIMKKLEILENLEIQFAEMKAENKAIKESIQQILESQLPF